MIRRLKRKMLRELGPDKKKAASMIFKFVSGALSGMLDDVKYWSKKQKMIKKNIEEELNR